MLNLTTTPDVRDLDCLYLATIAGADYYELRQVVRDEGGRRSVIGRASDWPLIELRAQKALLEALLTESECHLAELIEERDALNAWQAAYDDEIATLRAAVLVPAPVEPGNRERVAASPDGFVACDWPDCGWRGHPRGLAPHKRKKHGVKGATGKVPSNLDADHGTPAPDLALAEPPWRCADCGTSTHTRSISDPTKCLRCAADSLSAHKNGHLAAA